MNYTIVQSRNVKSGRIERFGKDDVWVVYTTGDGRTDSVMVPAETYSLEELDKYVKQNEELHGTSRGTTREI